MKRMTTGLLAATLALALAGAARASVRVSDEMTVFRYEGAQAQEVWLVGDFNGWNPTIDQLEPVEGAFEISLYLLPGSYRYRFIVDGVSTPDSGNPLRDEGGNSLVVLVKGEAGIEIQTTGAPAAAGGVKEAVELSTSAQTVIDEDGATLYAEQTVRGKAGEHSSADLGVGMTAVAPEGGTGSGASFLLRASAAYKMERGTFTAFSRSGEVGFDDPLSLFTPVGPFRYPLRLFCRGVSFDGKLPFGIDLSTFYASRIEGYRSGLESGGSPGGLFAERDLVDADLIGAMAGAGAGRTKLQYLFRQDRRPKQGTWQLPDLDGALITGFERARFQGLWIRVSGDAGAAAEGEILWGRRYLSALGESSGTGAPFEPAVFDRRWETGHRMTMGVSVKGQRSESRLFLSETTLDGDPRLRDGRRGGERTLLEASHARETDRFSVALGGSVESFSSGNPGDVFWIARTNFWLDGDELTYDLVPFVSARQLYEASLVFQMKGSLLGGISRGEGLRASITQRESIGGGALFREIGASKGILVGRRAAVIVDMRAVSYRHEGTRRDFLDAFVALHGRIASTLWCMVGCGVNPYGFDPWLYEFSDHGRADYLLDRGVFRTLSERGESAAVKTLIDAEDALAEDFMITFEAGYSF